jgi:hypothetical protein
MTAKGLRGNTLKGGASSQMTLLFIARTVSVILKNSWQKLKVYAAMKQLISEIPDYIDSTLWADFIQHRKEIRHKLTPTATKYLLQRLAKFHAAGIDVNLCITQSIENGWQGIFEATAKKETMPKTESEVLALGAKNGVEPRAGESWFNFKGRLESIL